MTKNAKNNEYRPAVRLVANLEDEATGKGFNIYKFKTVDGTTRKLEIERSRSLEPRQLLNALADANAVLPDSATERAQMIEQLATSAPQTMYLAANRTGWRSDGKAFVQRHSVIGNRDERNRIVKPPIWSRDLKHATKELGTLEEWQATIGENAHWSSALMISIATAFAAPLTRSSQLQPFIIAICGRSKTGKTVALLAAGSIIGIGNEDDLPKWNITVAGLDQQKRQFNDMVLIVDETGAAEGSSSDMHKRLRPVIFQYSSGTDRTRHSKSGFSSTGSQSEARGIMLIATEHSFDGYAREAGEVRVGGEYARALDINAVAAGNSTIIDRWPRRGARKGMTKRQWSEETLTAVRHACSQQHGTAFAAFISVLVDRGQDAVATEVHELKLEFEQALDLNECPQELRHAAKNLGLIYAGGALAIKYGIWPVKPERLLQALKRAFKALNATMTTFNPEAIAERAGKDLLRKLQAAQLPHKRELASMSPVAFRVESDRGQAYCVTPAELQRLLGDAAQAVAAVRWLHREGLLEVTSGNRHVTWQQVNMTTGTVFEKLGHGGDRKNHRVVRFMLPDGLMSS